MNFSIKLTLTAVLCSCLTITSVSEAGKFSRKSFGKINGGSQFKSRSVRKPSTSNFHHNFNYKQRGGSNRSQSSSNFNKFQSSNFQKTQSNRFSNTKSLSNNSRFTNNSQFKNLASKNSNRLKSGVNNSRTRDFKNIANQQKLVQKNQLKKSLTNVAAKKPGLFDGYKPGQGGWNTIMPVDPELGVHKPNPGYGNDIVFPKPKFRPHGPIFCPPGRRPHVCLPPINICPPVFTPCVTRVCGPVVGAPVVGGPIVGGAPIVEEPVVEAPVEEELEPVMQLVVGQPTALAAEGLGTTAGQVVFEVNGLGLPAKVNVWEDKQLGMEVPMIGLTGPTVALMHLIDAEGQPLASIPVELLREAPAAE